MKKKILLIIISIVIFGLALYFFASWPKSQAQKIYKENVTVIERRSGKEVAVKINDETNNKELIINSNIFLVGDELEVEYFEEGKDNIISLIKYEPKNETEKKVLVDKILSDPSTIWQQEKLSISRTVKAAASTIYALPVCINKQTYQMISPEDFFIIASSSNGKDVAQIKTNELIKLTGKESFKVIEFYNSRDGEKTSIEYKYVEEYEKEEIMFNGIGKGTYVIKVEFKSGDIFDYIFI